jgi:hypothetical protein
MNRAVVETALEALRQLGRKRQAHGNSGQTETQQPKGPANPVAPCGSPRCGGCYSLGVLDGRERFIHPPKASVEGLRQWEPKGKPQ